jgi:hypothetical protein
MIYKIISIVILSVLISACKSPSKLVEEGNYDKAIERSVKKLLKGNAKPEDKIMLDKAYKLANLEDADAIKLLITEGKPENWEQIYFTYLQLDRRQKEVRKVLPFQIKGKTIDYVQTDYSSLIIESKIKAAEYFYAHGKLLMSKGVKEMYRLAYNDFVKAKNYRESAFPDITQLIDEAKYLGTSRVLIEVLTNTDIRLPPDFYDKIMDINISSLNSYWIDYSIGRFDRNTSFDYNIDIILQNVFVSPEKYNSTEILRTKKVNDGFEYVLDSKGNVKKDSLGNDIKVPKYKYLTCKLITREQTKEAMIEAKVQYILVSPRKILKNETVAGSSIFNHHSAKAIGNIDALLPEDLELIKVDALPFPDDISIIYDCLIPLKKSIEDVLRNNNNIIQ